MAGIVNEAEEREVLECQAGNRKLESWRKNAHSMGLLHGSAGSARAIPAPA